MKILSLIVPSYNSERYLDKCIPSFFAEGILDKLDIIIVNDGSTDGTAETAEKYCRRYPGSVRLISQENKGHGGALNTGFAAAKGKYLKPVDADDWVETQNMPRFLELLEGCESDVVLTHYNTVDAVTGEICKFKSYPAQFGTPMTMDEVMADWRSFFRAMTFHGIAYNTTFYHTHGIRLSEHVFYEDNEYATFPSSRAQTVTAFDLFVYDYRVGDVNQSISLANQTKRLGQLETVVCRMMQEYNTLPEGAGKGYAAMKTQGVLLSYVNLALLAHPDKKTGRQMAARVMAESKAAAPEIYGLVLRKYQILTLLSRLHVSKTSWDKFLNSKFYNRLRGSHHIE